jgi:hypothetical protein
LGQCADSDWYETGLGNDVGSHRRANAVLDGADAVSGRAPGLTGESGATYWRYSGRMSSQRVPGGVVHKLPADLRKALIANGAALAAWNDITPLARNEFICWVEDAKQEMTRKRRIRRTQEELEEGQRRPCCWPGCKHREAASR